MKFSDLYKKNEELNEKKEVKISDNSFKNKNEIKHQKDINEELQKPIEENKEILKKEVFFSIKKDDKKREIEKQEVKKELVDFDEEVYIEKTRIIYSDLIKNIINIYKKIIDGFYSSCGDSVVYLADLIVRETKENQYIFSFLKYLTPKNYLYSHSINLSLITAGIMNEMGYSDDEIRKTVCGALLIDIGMIYYASLFNLERELTKEEKKLIKNHVNDGISIAEKIFAFDFEILRHVKMIINNSHERYNGSGYYGIIGDKLDEISQIVAISDFYEALTHQRPWRKQHCEIKVMNMFMNEYKKLFSPQSIKGIVSLLTIYPPQSFVKLSTGEIGKVILINRDKITRPIIKITGELNNISKDYIVDLREFPLTYIECAVSCEDLIKINPDFVIKETLKWLWMDW